jgi:hypothetical protein
MLKLNIRENSASGRVLAEDRLPGEPRKWPPVEAFRAQTRHLPNYSQNYSCHRSGEGENVPSERSLSIK